MIVNRFMQLNRFSKVAINMAITKTYRTIELIYAPNKNFELFFNELWFLIQHAQKKCYFSILQSYKNNKFTKNILQKLKLNYFHAMK